MDFTAEQLDAVGRFFQTVGWPGIIYLTVIFGGYKWWVFHTQVKWPQERSDRMAADTARAKREDDWYALIGKTVSNGEKTLMVLGLAFPEIVTKVNQSVKD